MYAGGNVGGFATSCIVLALDSQTGKTLWSTTFSDNLSNGITVSGGIVYFAGMSGVAYALDATSGSTTWTAASLLPPDSPMRGPIAVSAAGIAYVAVSGLLVAYDGASGDQLWKYSLGGPMNNMVSSPVIDASGTLYVGSQGTNSIVGLNSTDGAVLFTWQNIGSIGGCAALAPDLVVIAARTEAGGILAALV